MAQNVISGAFNPEKSSVKDLKRFLREHGEYVSGNKKELISRAKGCVQLGLKPLREIEENDEATDNHHLARRFTTSVGEELPHPTSLNGWSREVENIPSITEKDLYNYLVLNTSRTFDKDGMKANRSLKAKVFFKDGHVHSVQHHIINDSCTHCYVKCKVVPSIATQKENQKPDYDVWICMSKITGHIHSAGCNCSAGLVKYRLYLLSVPDNFVTDFFLHRSVSILGFEK